MTKMNGKTEIAQWRRNKQSWNDQSANTDLIKERLDLEER